MKLLTVFQIIQAFTAYSCLTLLFPCILLHKRFSIFSLPERLIGYFLAGNFYIIYLVFALQFLHISSQVTLWIGTVLPFAIYVIAHYRKELPSAVTGGTAGFVNGFIKVLKSELGVKTLLSSLKRLFADKIYKRYKRKVLKYLPEIILALLLFAGLIYVYGPNMIENLGYKASDMPIHNLWINEMDDNNIFAKGVYPHGFHCMIYYIHAAFGIRTYVLLRVFSFVQVVYIHLALLVSLKVICKTRFAPFLGTGVFLMVNIYSWQSYYRYLFTLPQEYGMQFILPAAVLAMRFFQEFALAWPRRGNKAGEAESGEVPNIDQTRLKDALQRQRSRWYLVGFCVSFSLTITAHFYNTMPLGIFCIGIALGFIFRFCHWRYFWRIMLAGIASVIIAIVPMAIGVMMGRQLEGSLRWGMSIILGSRDAEDTQIINDQENESEPTDEIIYDAVYDSLEYEESHTDLNANGGDKYHSSAEYESSESYSQVKAGERENAISLGKKIKQFVDGLKPRYYIIKNMLTSYCANASQKNAELMIFAIFAVCVLGMAALLKDRDYAGPLLSYGAYMLMMCVMLAAEPLGLTQLMQPDRASVFFCYSMGGIWALTIDSALYLCLDFFKRKWLLSAASALSIVVCSATVVAKGMVKTPRISGAFEMNESIMCLTNLEREHADFTWTIISANDERNMILPFARHYEMITFLREIADIENDKVITMPTEYIYVFIEKKPINTYLATSPYGGLLESVSIEGASEPLSTLWGTEPYMQEARWTTMSHMYYWAQAFKKLHPDDMTVYFEDDNFVCYEIHQNVNALYNLAIDYGYNNPKASQEDDNETEAEIKTKEER